MRLLVSASLLALAACNYAEPETHLIPEGYTGYVYVVQSDTLGEPEQHEEGRRLYRIPSDGLLLTRFGSNDGIIDAQYFYVRADGSRQEIAADYFDDDAPAGQVDTAVTIQHLSTGVLGNSNVPFQQYFVGTESDMDEWDYRTAGDVSDALERRGVVIE